MYLGGENDMNIAVIIAGGRGVRMGKDVPKQFIFVGWKTYHYRRCSKNIH